MKRSSTPRPWLGSAPSCLLLGSLASLAACESDSGSGYKQSCKQTCARAHDCVSTVNADTCTDDCVDSLSEVGDHLRSDYVKGIDACFADLSCDQLVAALTSNSCRDEASARLAPSEAAIELCEAVVDSLHECIGLSTGTAGCLDSVKIFNDSSLESALTCKKRECADRFGCLQDELGISLTP